MKTLVQSATATVAIASLLVLIIGSTARANSISVTCTGSPNGGRLVFSTGLVVPFTQVGVGVGADIQIPAGSTGAQKCTLLANAMAAAYAEQPIVAGDMATSVTGNTMTISSPGGDFISSFQFGFDSTGEFTTLSTQVDPGVLVSLEEYFANLSAVPDEGTFFSGFLIKPPIFGTFGVLADGTKDGAALLSGLNNSFSALTGVSFNQPIFDGSQQIGWRTPPFDPAAVEIGWDGNTALDLANFGMELIAPGSVPEPATPALLALCFGMFAAARIRATYCGRHAKMVSGPLPSALHPCDTMLARIEASVV